MEQPQSMGRAAGETHRLLKGSHRGSEEAGDDHAQDMAQQRPVPAEETERSGTRQAQAGADRRCLEIRTGRVSTRLTKTPVSLKPGVLQQDGRWVSDVWSGGWSTGILTAGVEAEAPIGPACLFLLNIIM